MSECDRLSDGTAPLAEPAIVQYYNGRLSATRCASSVRREGLAWTGDADSKSLLRRLADLDPDLGKTWTLVRGGASRAEPIPGLRRWLRLVVEDLGARGMQSMDPRHVVEDLLPASVPLKGRTDKRTVHLLRLTILDLHWQGCLSGEDVAGAFVRYFVNSRDSTEALERHALVALLKCSGAPQFRALSRTIGWSLRRSAEQSVALAASGRDLRRVREEKVALETDVVDLKGKVDDLRNQLEARAAQVRRLENQLQESRDSAILRLHDLAGQVSGKLNGRIDRLLAQASEALAMREPRVRAAREFVQTSQEGIGELTRWLAAELTSGRPTV